MKTCCCALAVLLAVGNTAVASTPMIDGPFPLLCTPYTESGEVDY